MCLELDFKTAILQLHCAEGNINTVKLLPGNGAIPSYQITQRQRQAGQSRHCVPASFLLCQNSHRDKPAELQKGSFPSSL